MFILTARLSRKKAVFFTVLAVVGVVLIGLVIMKLQSCEVSQQPQLITNEDRITYLQTWGWEVNPEPIETFQLILPENLTDSYQVYNELQKSQGFDLTRCCGKQISRYTYAITNYPGRTADVQANLYICEGLPAAGDVISSGTDGFQSGLAFPDKKGA